MLPEIMTSSIKTTGKSKSANHFSMPARSMSCESVKNKEEQNKEMKEKKKIEKENRKKMEDVNKSIVGINDKIEDGMAKMNDNLSNLNSTMNQFMNVLMKKLDTSDKEKSNEAQKVILSAESPSFQNAVNKNEITEKDKNIEAHKVMSQVNKDDLNKTEELIDDNDDDLDKRMEVQERKIKFLETQVGILIDIIMQKNIATNDEINEVFQNNSNENKWTEIVKKKKSKSPIIQDEISYCNKNLKLAETKVKRVKRDVERLEVSESIIRITEESKQPAVDIKKLDNDDDIITLDERDERIEKVMDINKRTFGIVFKSKNMTEAMIKQLEDDKSVSKDMKKEDKLVMANRKLVDYFMTNEVRLPKEIWKEMKVTKLHNGTKNDKSGEVRGVIYVQMEKIEDVNAIKRELSHLTQEENNRVIPYIHPKGYERHRKLDGIAYQYRLKGNMTKIQPGRYDYKLSIKPRGDSTEWKDIAPLVNPIDLPKFRVGKLSKEDEEFDRMKIEERRKNAKEKYEEMKNKKKKKEEEMDEEMKRIISESALLNLDISEMEEEKNDGEDNSHNDAVVGTEFENDHNDTLKRTLSKNSDSDPNNENNKRNKW